MKRMLCLICICFSLGASASLPVIDFSNLISALERARKLSYQIRNLQQSVKQGDLLNAALSGLRHIAAGLPFTYGGKLNAFPINQILQEAHLAKGSSLGLTGAAAQLFDAQNASAASRLGLLRTIAQRAKQRVSTLRSLQGKLGSAPQQKDVLDLQARTSAEETLLANESVRLKALNAQKQAEEEVYKRKAEQVRIKSFGKRRHYSWGSGK